MRIQVAKGDFGLLFTDGSKFGRAEQLHLALLGVWEFHKRENRLPEVGNLKEAEEVVKLAIQVMSVRRMASYTLYTVMSVVSSCSAMSSAGCYRRWRVNCRYCSEK